MSATKQDSGKEKFLEYVKKNDVVFSNMEITEKTKNVLHINNKTAISDIVLLSNEEICNFKSIDKESAIEIINCKNNYLREHKTAIVEYATRTVEEEKECETTTERKRYPKASPSKDFVIKKGVLKKYNGKRREVVIPVGVTSIGRSAFEGCINLTAITISDGVTSIVKQAFKGCTNLITINIPNSVTSIGERAFYGCTNLLTVSLPASVTSIGFEAFKKCENLTYITIPDSVKGIGYIGFSDTAYYKNDSNWENDVLYIGNHLIKSKDTVLSKDVIKLGTKTIARNAFIRCKNLTTITIPNGVTSIGGWAFEHCTNLITIIIPDSVTSIGKQAFLGCESLIIHAPAGSYAEQYAKENEISFVAE